MATLTAQSMVLTGLEATYASADALGDEFAYDKNTFIHIINGDGSDHTITLNTVKESNYGETPDVAVVVTAGEERFIWLGDDTLRFKNSAGRCDVTYDEVSSVTIAILKVGR